MEKKNKKSKMKTDRLCDHRIMKTPHIFLLFTDCKKWLRHEGEEKCFGGEEKMEWCPSSISRLDSMTGN